MQGHFIFSELLLLEMRAVAEKNRIILNNFTLTGLINGKHKLVDTIKLKILQV